MRIGIDLGGTKIEGIVLNDSGVEIARARIETPRGDYAATLKAIAQLIAQIDPAPDAATPVGIGIPGTISPATGLIKNANSTWLVGKPFDRDLAEHLERPVRVANDANCFTISEATDGVAEAAETVFGVIVGTGVGGGLVNQGKIMVGGNAIAGEWGHTPLPWMTADEFPGRDCFCGRRGCIETFVSGPAFERDHTAQTGQMLSAADIAAASLAGDADARASLLRLEDRLARSLAMIINIIDPNVIVLGGGLSNIDRLYENLPGLIDRHIFSDSITTPIRKARHGDSSGVRGAAWLWPVVGAPIVTEKPQSVHTGLCRDCAASVPPGTRSCPACAAPRILTHRELDTLSIAHIDCDAFYASVEKRDDPSLRDKPVIVGGRQRGVVSAACYIARIKGVHSAMPMFQALKLCPDATVIRPDMEKYSAVGRQIRDMMREITPLVEPLSIDEAFLDLTGTQRLHQASPAKSLIRLVNQIEREIGVTASVGLSYNKFLAKLASDIDKPRGFAVIGRGEALTFLDTLPVSRIWGVGKSLHRKLNADGLHTIGQIRGHDEARLMKRYGAIGQRLARFSHGEDSRAVKPHSVPKNLSSETTFSEDIADLDALTKRLWPLCEKVTDRMKMRDLAGRTVTLKLKSSQFKTLTRSHALPAPTQLAETLYQAAVPLLERAIAAAPSGSTFRLIGVGLSNFADPLEADPPDLADPDADHRKRIEAVIDQVRDKLGHDAIGKGRSIRGGKDKKPAVKR